MGVHVNFAIISGIITLILCMFTLGKFVLFLSSFKSLNYPQDSDAVVGTDSVWIPLILDVILLMVFVIQHSLQACQSFKIFLLMNGLDVVERLLYIFGSCVSLQVLMYFWQPVHDWTVWDLKLSKNSFMWWCFAAVHLFAWLIIYSGCFIMDVTELLGVKQGEAFVFCMLV